MKCCGIISVWETGKKKIVVPSVSILGLATRMDLQYDVNRLSFLEIPLLGVDI